MSDDYLWNREGEVDPEVERLEKILGTLRHEGSPPRLTRRPAIYWMAAAATIVLGSLGVVVSHHASWSIDPTGAVRLDGRLLESSSSLSRDSLVETGPDARATLTIGLFGTTTLAPGTRVTIQKTALRESRLDLKQGMITARIGAPPRLFYVSTTSAEAIDLGCAYELSIDSVSGSGRLRVTHGWVALDADTGRVFVPSGSSVTILGRGRLSVPLRDRAGESLRSAVAEVVGTLPAVATDSLEMIDRTASREDALTIWHLIRRADRVGRRGLGGVLTKIAPGIGVDLVAVQEGDEDEIERIGKRLGARESTWWAAWMRQGLERLRR